MHGQVVLITSLRRLTMPTEHNPVLTGLALGALCMLVTLASAVSPSVALGAAIAAAVVFSTVRFPAFGMAMLVGFFLVQSSRLYDQYGTLASRGATVADIAGVLVLVGVALEAYKRRADTVSLLRQRGLAPFLSVVFYFGWLAFTSVWSSAPALTLVTFLRTEVEAPLLLLVALLTLRDRHRVRLAMAAYVIAGLLLALYVVSNYASLHGAGSAVLSLSAQAAYRGGQTGYNENELSVIIAIVPAMAYLATGALSMWPRLAFTALTVPPSGVAVVVLTSRGAIISLGAGVVAALLLAQGGRARVALVAVSASCLAGFAILTASGGLPAYFQRRFQLIGSDQIGGRGPVWQLALDLFARHPLGLGAAAFEQLVPTANVALYAGVSASHSDYFGTLVDYGVIGGLLLVAMLFFLGREIILVGGRRNPAIVATFTILVVAIAGGNFLDTHWYWTIMALILCYALTAPPSGEESPIPSTQRMAQLALIHKPRSPN